MIVVEDGIDNLSRLAHRKFWKADRGRHGQGSNRHGKSAPDLVIQVPSGTVVFDANHKLVMRDLVCPGDQVVAARGGKGGKGNAHFKSSTNRAPREWTPGDEGEADSYEAMDYELYEYNESYDEYSPDMAGEESEYESYI